MMTEDYDDPVYLDMEKIEESINSGEITVPKGLSPEERRAWVRGRGRVMPFEKVFEVEDKILCPQCNGSGMGDVWYHQDENGDYEIEHIKCERCDGFGFVYLEEEV